MTWLLALVYFFPSIWAFYRNHLNKWTLLAINVLFGWTPVWFILLFVANAKQQPKTETAEILRPDFRCRYAAAIREEISSRLDA